MQITNADRVFITGSKGFLGQNLFNRLPKCNTYLYERDQDVRCLSRFSPTVVFHCAAEIYKEELMYESNVKLTHDLLHEASLVRNLRAFIYIGSSSEYGRKDHPMSEKDYLDPSNMYEATKGAGSLLCQGYARLGKVPAIVARPFSLYGKHEPNHRLIPTAIKKVRTRSPIDISPGVHDFIHIDDFIDGLFVLLDSGTPGEAYNFGTGIQTSNIEIVEMIEGIIGRHIEKNLVGKLHDYDSQSWVADISKAKELGWSPKISLREGLKNLCHS